MKPKIFNLICTKREVIQGFFSVSAFLFDDKLTIKRILDFVSISALFIMIGAEFVGMILLIVYVGAVAVLFLFVVMMLEGNFIKIKQSFLQYLPFGFFIGIRVI